jgi:peroxiredoxin
MNRISLLLCCSLVLLICCKKKSILQIPLSDLQGTKVKLQSWLEEHQAIAIVFLAPDCPLSQYYVLPLNELYHSYKGQIAMVGIVPDRYFSQQEAIVYNERYKLAFPLLMDEQMQLTERLNARITPEVFLLDSLQRLVYSGSIDNAAVDLTIKRRIITQHYLKDAMDAIVNHRSVSVKRTKAVGCYIERKR